MSKWILVILGYTFFRFPGALFGYFLGGLIEGSSSKNKFKRQNIRNISSQDFELNLLALASLVIKADGTVSSKNWIMLEVILCQLMERKEQTLHLKYLTIILTKKEFLL